MQAQYEKEQHTLLAHRKECEQRDQAHEKARDEWFAEKRVMQETHADARKKWQSMYDSTVVTHLAELEARSKDLN
jgi:Zn/Cd-binding protein ZinT